MPATTVWYNHNDVADLSVRYWCQQPQYGYNHNTSKILIIAICSRKWHIVDKSFIPVYTSIRCRFYDRRHLYAIAGIVKQDAVGDIYIFSRQQEQNLNIAILVFIWHWFYKYWVQHPLCFTESTFVVPIHTSTHLQSINLTAHSWNLIKDLVRL